MKFIHIFALLIILSACVSKPDGMGEVAKVNNLGQLEGTYLNQPTEAGSHLSWILFPRDKNNNAPYGSNFKYIKVTKINEKQLRVIGLNDRNEALRNEIFTEGDDFTFENGEIKLKSDTRVLDYKAGDYFLGVTHDTNSFVLNEKGDAVYKNEGGGAGLLLFPPMPIAAKGTDYFQYKKLY